MKYIIPKSKTTGVDFCGMKEYCYIIRSDLGCYMQTSTFSKSTDLTIFKLHPSCQNGDHYLADKDGYFYIIKGDSYRRVTDLSTDRDAEVSILHTFCQGGDHYFSASGYFYIIFQRSGTYRRAYHLGKDPIMREYKLHPSCSDGLYYWGLPDRFCFLKPASKCGVEYNESTELDSDKCFGVYSVDPDVLNFLPGGLSITRGRAFGKWDNIKTLSNDSDTSVTWQMKVIKKVGYKKEMTEITHNWKIGATIKCEDLAGLITKLQFSLSAEYGGSHVDTENESWDEATEVEEELKIELKPHENIYLWQYKLGLGDEPVLFCRKLIIKHEPSPPTDVPLSLAEP